MQMSQSVGEIATALVAAQQELPQIVKDKVARAEKFSYSYASLDTIMPAALRVLSKHGLAVVQPVGNGAGEATTVTTMLLHTSGEWIADTQPLILARNDSQGQGSAITYARRYGLMSMIGMVADEDDDGQANTAPRPAPRAAAQAVLPRKDAAGSTEPQQKAIHVMLSKLFPKDERAQYAWMQEHAPGACVSDTQYSTAALTKQEASQLLDLTQRALDQRGEQPPGDPGPQEP